MDILYSFFYHPSFVPLDFLGKVFNVVVIMVKSFKEHYSLFSSLTFLLLSFS